MSKQTQLERAFRRVDRSEDTDCWIWTGPVQNQGYGHISLGPGWHELAHRFFYERLVGRPIPDGMVLHHVCHNKLCVRPDHLECVTVDEHRQLHTKMHCKHGHPMTGDNVYLRRSGVRQCRACLYESIRRYKVKVRGPVKRPRRAV
jgi:hypothetical protein